MPHLSSVRPTHPSNRKAREPHDRQAHLAAQSRLQFCAAGRLSAQRENRPRRGCSSLTFGYILSESGAAGRVGAVRITNCAAESPSLAVKEIFATQALNKRSRSDRTYHLVVAFEPGERPTQAQLQDIEDTLCEAIGLGAHQRISTIHTNRAHLHLHIAINKIAPQTLRCVEPFYDKRKLMAACEALEKKHGLAQTNHGRSNGRPQGQARQPRSARRRSLLPLLREGKDRGAAA